jgi:hypothetical protein
VVVGPAPARSFEVFSGAFWGLDRKLVLPDIPPGGVDVFGCTRAFRDQLLAIEERNTSLVGLLFWLGFRRLEVPYERRERRHGSSAWSFRKRIRYLLDATFAFSDLPIRLVSLIGLAGIAASLVLGAIVLWAKLQGDIPIPGYAATVSRDVLRRSQLAGPRARGGIRLAGLREHEGPAQLRGGRGAGVPRRKAWTGERMNEVTAGFFQHPSAIVESTRIGEGTRIGAFTHVLPGARVGRDCNLCDHVGVENDVLVGDRVTVKSGVQLWDGIELEDDVFVGPNATFASDRPSASARTRVMANPRANALWGSVRSGGWWA